MKKTLLYPFTILLLVAFTAVACSSKYPGFKKTDTGLYYKIYKVSTDTAKAKVGDYVALAMRYTTADDSLLFDSKAAMGDLVRFQLPESDFKGDIYEGIRMMSAGDSAAFIVSADSLFLKTFRQAARPPFIDSNSVIKFHIHLVSADSKEKLEENEKTMLSKYITDNNITVQPNPSGLYFIEKVKGTGSKIDSGSIVMLHFSLSTTDGKPLFSSYDRGEPLRMEAGKPFDTPGFDEGVANMTKGGKATFIVPSSIAFGAQGRGGMILPYTTLIYDVEIMDVMSKAAWDKEQEMKKKAEEAKKEAAKGQEMSKLNQYLKANNITVKPTLSGLYYIENNKGTGIKASAGKKVKVHYTGTLLDGTKFDSSRDRNEPFEFVLGQGQVIKGWDEGIAMMNVGSKATFIIPSKIAYGERDMGTIPPYSTLVFDVELLEVK